MSTNVNNTIMGVPNNIAEARLAAGEFAAPNPKTLNPVSLWLQSLSRSLRLQTPVEFRVNSKP
jgi:hypothetical protein